VGPSPRACAKGRVGTHCHFGPLARERQGKNERVNKLYGLHDFLVGIYEALVDEFQDIRRQIKRGQLEPRYVMKLRLIDEIIVRLRGM